MISVIEAPARYEFNSGLKKLFMAGGITGCGNWQQELIGYLREEEMMVFNPRRENFPIDDPSAAQGQIEWEYNHFLFCDAVSFWFPSETLCPITLFELGKCSVDAAKIFVGVHPDYKRKQDVIIQMGLELPELQVVFSLEELASQIKQWNREAPDDF